MIVALQVVAIVALSAFAILLVAACVMLASMSIKVAIEVWRYAVHKKAAKKAEWKTIGEVLKETQVPSQLDRIERKLDELLVRPYCQPTPVPWSQPPMPSQWYNNPNAPHPPTDPYGNPVVYCSSNGGAR